MCRPSGSPSPCFDTSTMTTRSTSRAKCLQSRHTTLIDNVFRTRGIDDFVLPHLDCPRSYSHQRRLESRMHYSVAQRSETMRRDPVPWRNHGPEKSRSRGGLWRLPGARLGWRRRFGRSDRKIVPAGDESAPASNEHILPSRHS